MYLKDASWIVPLLQAHMRGETIQCRHGCASWQDMGNRVEFALDASEYRIKPKIPEYRLFQYADGLIALVTRYTASARQDFDTSGAYEIYAAGGRGKWITEWLPLPDAAA